MNSNNESIQTELNLKFESIQTELHLLKSTISFVSMKITPSDGCKTEKNPDFLKLVEALDLRINPNLSQIVTGFSEDDHNCEFLPFEWTWNNRKEKDSYPLVVDYLNSQRQLNGNAFEVQSGSKLSQAILFDVAVYSVLTPPDKKPNLVTFVKGILIINKNKLS